MILPISSHLFPHLSVTHLTSSQSTTLVVSRLTLHFKNDAACIIARSLERGQKSKKRPVQVSAVPGFLAIPRGLHRPCLGVTGMLTDCELKALKYQWPLS